MLFNSIEFLLFFPLVTLLYFLTPFKQRWIPLLLASCIFYMFFIPVYIFILLFTIVIDYYAGIAISKTEKHKKRFLILSIVANVGVLAFFKYFNFFADNINFIAHKELIPILNIILPIGLSFHTFQAMSYTIEVYRGNQKPEKHFGIYALYVMFYPQLVAGPIERPQNLLPQFRAEHKFDSVILFSGLRLMLWGLFKKVVVADRLAIYVDAIYSDPVHYSHYLNILIAFVFFSFQIYCDFSGYSDMALGSAKAMGFDLMVNFDRPYFSKNIKEFWTRWHISLSTWFRDYVYIPLGGNKVKTGRLYFNLFIVFILSGIWHGANWTFFAWGALHALFLIFYLAFGKHILKKENPINNFIAGCFTFCLVTLAWVFFRAENFDEAFLLLKNFFTFNQSSAFTPMVTFNKIQFGISSLIVSVLMIIFTITIEKFNSVTLTNFNTKKISDVLFCSLILTLIVFLGVFQKNSFIYFQF